MTPEERRELAERLDRMAALNERTAKVMGNLGRGWADTAADLRAAAAALRKDADMGQRASDELRERLADAVVIPSARHPGYRDALAAGAERLRMAGGHDLAASVLDDLAALLSGQESC